MRYAVNLLMVACLAAALVLPASEARSVSLIRDAEIEWTIRDWSEPIFRAAGLQPEAITVHLVNDRSLNAFVAAGQRIFINTGLLQKVRTPNELIGVIAHETGHIAGGHLARFHDATKNATATSILGMVLGAAAMIAGAPQAAGAAVLGSQQIAQRSFLQFTRTQESSADQAAVSYLQATGQSARGLVDFLGVLGDQEALLSSRQDPYVRTHPLSRERISALQNRVARESAPRPDSAADELRLELIHAKLDGYLGSLTTTLRTWPESDTSVPARYARAFAYYRAADIGRALPLIDGLIAEQPDYPFFYELKGQILLESGKVEESIEPLRKSVRLAPQESLLMVTLAQSLLATENPAHLAEAEKVLQESLRLDQDSPSAWRQLAIAQGRLGHLGLSALANAEYLFRIGDYRDAYGQAQRAARMIPAGAPGQLRATDIESEAKRALDEQQARRR
ncbi:MAG: M48 family metalloprotease [Sneathiellaceae bacterium]